MKKIIQRLLLSGLFGLLFGSMAQGQTDLTKVLQATNVAALQQMSVELKQEAEAAYTAAYGMALLNNWPIREELEDGRIIQLIRLDDNGNPIYYSTTNAAAAATTRTDRVHEDGGAGLSLSGDGMVIGEWDGGMVRETHQELIGRVTQIDTPDGISNHATHVCGTLVGTGLFSDAKGMAPEATVRAYDFNDDLAEMATEASNGLLVSNHSYGIVAGWLYDGRDENNNNLWTWFAGTNTYNANGEDPNFGKYRASTADWDEIAYNAPYYLIVKSAGNDRNNNPASFPPVLVRDATTGTYEPYNASNHPNGDGKIDNGYDCMSAKGCAKNILTVGAVDDVLDYTGSNAVIMSNFSGWGPTDDGRIKPDIVGNGVSLTSASGTANNEYYMSSGTSMSSPNVAGSCLLLQEHYQDTHGGGNFMRSATLKALVIHTADEVGVAEGPDYQYGWGLMNTEQAAMLITEDAINATVISENTLSNGSTFTRNITSDGTQPLTITIAWTDPEASAEGGTLDSATPKLVNDLDIRLSDGTTTFEPYILNPVTPSIAASTGDNTRDNVEKIYLGTPDAGDYTLTISHKGSLINGTQFFSLIATGGVSTMPEVNCLTADSLELVKIYHALDGANWTNTWDLNEPVEDWYGIDLTEDKCNVNRVRLNNNGLQGAFPLIKLSELLDLWLSFNEITSVPDFELPKLINLRIPNINVSTVPNWTKLSSLKELDISNCPLVNVPNWTNLLTLERLILGNCTLTDVPNWGNLPNLKSLNLDSNNLTSVPNWNFPNLTSLVLSHNQLESVPQWEASNLALLWLYNNQLTEVPHWNFQKIYNLQLQFNQLTTLPNWNLLTVNTLYLHSNQLESIPNWNTPNLEDITLVANHLTDIPNFVTNKLRSFQAHTNRLNFTPLLPYGNRPLTLFYVSYFDQAKIPIYQDGNQLYVEAGGEISDNTYKWYKDGELLTTVEGDKYFTLIEHGNYHCEVTNVVVTKSAPRDLILSSETFTIEPECDLIITPTITHTTCGQDNGAITLNIIGGTGNYTVAWSTLEDGLTITNLAKGKYSATVTDNNNCSEIVEVIVSFADQPVVKWSKSYGGSAIEGFRDIQPTNDGGYIAVGTTASTDGDITENKGGHDAWILKINQEGETQWSKTYGGSDSDDLTSIIPLSEGGYIVSGKSESRNGDLQSSPTNGQDIWIFKIDAVGNLEWSQTYGGFDRERFDDFIATSDGGYIGVGYTSSYDSPTGGGAFNGYIVKMDNAGNMVWSKVLGGDSFDQFDSVIETNDGHYLIGGYYEGYHGWLLKLDTNGNEIWLKEYGNDTNRYFFDDILDLNNNTYLLLGRIAGDSYGAALIDDQGNIIWEKQISNGFGTGNNVRKGLLMEDGHTILIGYSHYHEEGIQRLDGWINKINNTTGNVIWSKYIGDVNDDFLQDIHMMNNGDIILSGTSEFDTGYGAEYRDGWITVLTNPELQVDLGEDQTISSDESIQLDATVADCSTCTYLWNDGFTEPIRTVSPTTTTTYTVTVSDGGDCSVSDDITIFVTSNLEFNIGDICGAPNSTISIPVSIKNFNGITGFQYSMHIPANIGIVNNPPASGFGLTNLKNSDFTRIDDQTITVTWEAEDIENGETLADETVIYYIDIQLTGDAGAEGNAYIDGNPTAVEVIQGINIVEAQFGTGLICINSTYELGGQILTYYDEPIQNVEVAATGDITLSRQTDNTGQYHFATIDAGSNLTITPSKNTGVTNGVSIQDAVQIKGHIRQVSSLKFTSPYQYIAADVNDSGTVSILDVIFIKKAIRGEDSNFPINKSWRFIPADYEFPNPADPLSPAFPESKSYSPLNQNALNEDFIGIKLGDVNETADLGQLNSEDEQ